MLDKIGDFFRDRLQVSDDGHDTEDAARLAAAALLFEAAMSDYDLGDEERSMIQQLVPGANLQRIVAAYRSGE